MLISAFYLALIALMTTSCGTMQNKNMTQLKSPENQSNDKTYAVSYLNIIPLRFEPNHRSEMVSQVLFGEYMEVLKSQEEWSYVRLEQDAYVGWLETIQVHQVTQNEYDKVVNAVKVKVLDEFISVQIDGVNTVLTKGTNLSFYKNGFFIFNTKKIPFSGAVLSGEQNTESIINTALSYLNTPYLWGGKSALGLDCSGFSQLVYHINGYSIQRDASLQATEGELVAFLAEAQAGDLAFFENNEGRITHVGIVMNDEKIIHAAQGKVRIDKLDQEGIYNEELKKYTHHLRMIKRYF